MRIPRHTIEHARVAERFADANKELELFLESAQKSPRSLSLLLSTAMDVATCGSAVLHDPVLIRKALRLAGQASAALFATASAKTLPVQVTIGGGPVAMYSTRPDESEVYASQWLKGVFVNTLFGDRKLVADMCDTPTELLRTSSTKAPEYKYLFVDAIKAFFANGTDCSKLILEALEATDPQRSDIRTPDWTLNIDVPLLQHLFYVQKMDPDFAEQFPKAVELHKKYWTSSKKLKQDWNGLLAIELTAIAILARDRNVQFDIDSEYIPISWFVER